jgi:hypothetical protein
MPIVKACTATNDRAGQLIEFWLGRESAQSRTCAPASGRIGCDRAIYVRIFTAIDTWLDSSG